MIASRLCVSHITRMYGYGENMQRKSTKSQSRAKKKDNIHTAEVNANLQKAKKAAFCVRAQTSLGIRVKEMSPAERKELGIVSSRIVTKPYEFFKIYISKLTHEDFCKTYADEIMEPRMTKNYYRNIINDSEHVKSRKYDREANKEKEDKIKDAICVRMSLSQGDKLAQLKIEQKEREGLLLCRRFDYASIRDPYYKMYVSKNKHKAFCAKYKNEIKQEVFASMCKKSIDNYTFEVAPQSSITRQANKRNLPALNGAKAPTSFSEEDFSNDEKYYLSSSSNDKGTPASNTTTTTNNNNNNNNNTTTTTISRTEKRKFSFSEEVHSEEADHKKRKISQEPIQESAQTSNHDNSSNLYESYRDESDVHLMPEFNWNDSSFYHRPGAAHFTQFSHPIPLKCSTDDLTDRINNDDQLNNDDFFGPDEWFGF